MQAYVFTTFEPLEPLSGAQTDTAIKVAARKRMYLLNETFAIDLRTTAAATAVTRIPAAVPGAILGPFLVDTTVYLTTAGGTTYRSYV